MSTTEVPENMDDNLITRRKKIVQSIEDIRLKKSEIAQALRELGVSDPNQNEDVKKDMKHLVEAYDTISAQETQYMKILQTIVGIHEQATRDIATDFEKKIKEDAARIAAAKEKKEEEADEHREKTPEEMANGELINELQEALLELKKVQEAAVAAAELNEKLVEKFQLQKKKRSAMTELRDKKAKELDEEAAKVRAEVLERINKMQALKKTTTKQEKELKELQKQCAELGLELDDSKIPKAELNEEEKERRREEIRENIKKEMEKKEQVNTLIREKLAAMDARRQRLQQIRKQLETQEEKKQAMAAPKEQTGEGIPLSPETPRQSEEDADVIASLGEPPKIPDEAPFDPEAPAPEAAAPEAAQSAPSAPEEEEITEKSLDDILENAKANLSSLTAMRERLEHIKATGGADLDEGDLELLEKLESLDVQEQEEPEKPQEQK